MSKKEKNLNTTVTTTKSHIDLLGNIVHFIEHNKMLSSIQFVVNEWRA